MHVNQLHYGALGVKLQMLVKCVIFHGYRCLLKCDDGYNTDVYAHLAIKTHYAVMHLDCSCFVINSHDNMQRGKHLIFII